MAEYEADTLAQQAVLLGLVTQDQASEAMLAAEDGTFEAVARSFVRRGLLTGWQVERFKKGDINGLVYGGCKVLFHIAEGTFARVYRGMKMPGNQPVAIKVLRQRFVSDAVSVERFNKEAEAGMRLVHPNIVQIYDYGQEGGRHYMIMEYVEGSNLREFMKIRKRIEPESALPMMIGLARGLQYAWSQGVTHRDLKPTNILVATNGAAKLVDFGLATLRDVDKDKGIAAAHGERTVDYATLERTCNSPKGDPRSDIFFLGCVFYHMVSGQLPMPEVESKDPLAKMLKRGINAIKPLSEQRHAPPPGLTRIIERMMKVDLKGRYQTMDEVVGDLEAYQVEASRPAAPAGKPSSGGRDRFVDPDFGSLEDIFARREPEPEPAPAAPAPPPKNVLCVEVQEGIREAFRKALSRMGYRVLLVTDAGRAAERYREATPEAVVFDCDGLGPESLDAFLDMHEKAHEDGHDLAALVLLGPRQGALAEKLPTDDRLVVLTKPIKMKDVQDAVARLVPVG